LHRRAPARHRRKILDHSSLCRHSGGHDGRGKGHCCLYALGGAAGLTAEGLLEGLERFAADPRAEGLPAFVAQASGLLRLHPELCQALAAQVLSPSGPVRTRHFALELLAAAGSPEAQAAMRQVLEATGDARGAQRLSLLQRPTAETVRFVEAWWRSAAGPDRAPLALTLGATAGLLAHGGEAGAAAPALDALAAALASAQAPDDRRTQLLALGNAGAEAAVPAVLAHAADADPAVREAALEALRKTLTPAARAAMIPRRGGRSRCRCRWGPRGRRASCR
jgi:hypothetical protein